MTEGEAGPAGIRTPQRGRRCRRCGGRGHYAKTCRGRGAQATDLPDGIKPEDAALPVSHLAFCPACGEGQEVREPQDTLRCAACQRAFPLRWVTTVGSHRAAVVPLEALL